MSASARTSANGSAARATSGLWNPVAAFSRVVVIPSAPSLGSPPPGRGGGGGAGKGGRAGRVGVGGPDPGRAGARGQGGAPPGRDGDHRPGARRRIPHQLTPPAGQPE